MKMKYLLTLALVVLLGTMASMAFAADFVALQYNVPLTVTSVPTTNDFSGEAFSDIGTDFWAWAEILEASDTQTASTDAVVKGYGDGSFQPGFEVTRSMMAVFLANGLGLTTAPAEQSFGDVPESYWAYTQIEQCVQEGLVLGYKDYFGTDATFPDAFLPAATVARDQMAVFLVRATVGSTTAVYDGQFDDIVDSDSAGWWAKDEIVTCVDENIALGYDNGAGGKDFKPAKAVTRDQMAVFVWRALVRLNGNCVVLGCPAVTDDAAFAPSGGAGTAELFLPDELGGATGVNTALDEENELPVGEDTTAFVVLDAVQVPAGDITFRVTHLDVDENTVVDDEVVLTAVETGAKAAVEAADGVPWMLASYQVKTGLAAGDYTVEVELPNGAVLTVGEFTVP